jgi:hypothetical protein
MRRALAIAAVALSLAIAPANAQVSGNSGVFIIFGGSGKTLAQWQGQVTPSGSLLVSYHGDQAAGCAARGLCDTSGTIVWTPTAAGGAALVKVREHKRVLWTAAISLGTFFDSSGMTVVTHRTRADGSDAPCLDEVAPPNFLHVGNGHTSIPIDLAPSSEVGPSTLAGRCAGPTVADLRSALPKLRVAPVTLRRGTKLNFQGDRTFQAGGFAGTVSSTLVLRVSRMARTPSNSTSSAPLLPNTKPHKRILRTLGVGYRVIKVSGAVTLALRGNNNGGCELLDSCQTTGTLTITPSARGAQAFLNATSESPPARSFRELRQALGLLPGPVRSNTHPSGTIGLTQGTIAEALQHSDGATCNDRATRAQLQVELNLATSPATARLTNGSDTPTRTRCPGPLFTDTTVLRGTLARSQLRARDLTLRLTQPRHLQDDGWMATSTGTLTITLRRTRIRQRQDTITDPLP